MIVGAILKPGKTARVGTGLALQSGGTAIGQNEPRPGKQYAALPECDIGIIFADQP
jgi:hypothetical protein